MPTKELLETVAAYRDYMCNICDEPDHGGYCTLAKTIECMEGKNDIKYETK